MTKQAWRRTWFQVHKWIGLAIAVLVVPIGLSGAALVWGKSLDRALNPARYAVSGQALLAPSAYVAAALRVIGPGERIATLALPEGRGPVVIAAARAEAKPRPGPPRRTTVYLDPPSARVLQVSSSSAGLVRFLHLLHGSLQIPGGWGRTIVGLIGVAMAVSCFTGLWLWWPQVGRVARGLRWRRHRNTDANLHHLLGFWIALPLFVLSLTGAWISFPQLFGALVGEGAPRRPERAQPAERAALPVDQVVAKAAARSHARVRSVTWPTERSPDWTVAFARGRDVKVADDTGSAAIAAPAREPAGVARLMRRIHDGEGMGPVWQGVIFVGGIVPAVLAVTGVIMWWRARRWRRAAAARG